MHSEGLLGPPEKDHKNVIQKGCDDTYLPEAEDLIDMDLPEETGLNHVLAERRRREKLKRRFLVLRSLVPTTAKVDKISILDDTIKYLKELERKIDELESAKETAANTETTMVTKSAQDGTKETSSYNYEVEETHIASKKRRKAFDTGGNNINRRASSKRECNDDLVVEVEDKDVRVEVRCGWRKGLVPEVMEALSDLDLESTSVCTRSSDGILYLKITSKVQGLKVASAKLIKQEMERIVHNR
uniref:BHLH domain-containing protein n=1 Tax=Kalanchoe fedtschenkoi TaxID=63787 RepID=A0A7N0TQT6_KALFE